MNVCNLFMYCLYCFLMYCTSVLYSCVNVYSLLQVHYTVHKSICIIHPNGEHYPTLRSLYKSCLLT